MTDTHPLDGKDEWECYDQHIAERNRLIEGKRNSEDNFIKTVIQLSSAIALLVPGFLYSQERMSSQPSNLIILGLSLIFLSLLAGLSEQFLSSLAYSKQIQKTDEYYKKKTSDVSPPALSKIVSICLFSTFATFLGGVLVISVALLIGAWR
ncbi:MAG: hypothetical protein WCY92_08060 [Novosphingobium sp.]